TPQSPILCVRPRPDQNRRFRSLFARVASKPYHVGQESLQYAPGACAPVVDSAWPSFLSAYLSVLSYVLIVARLALAKQPAHDPSAGWFDAARVTPARR